MMLGTPSATRTTNLDTLASSFPALSVDARRALLGGSILHHLPAGRTLADPDDVCVGIVLRGTVRLFVWSRDARRAAVAHLGAGHTFGFAATLGRRAGFGILAVTEAQVLELDGHTVAVVAAAEPAMAGPLAQQVATELERAAASVQAVFGMSLRQRLAALLLELSCADREAPISIAHEGLADAIGTAREVVSRQMAQLERERLVRGGRRSVAVTDRAGLESVARGLVSAQVA